MILDLSEFLAENCCESYCTTNCSIFRIIFTSVKLERYLSLRFDIVIMVSSLCEVYQYQTGIGFVFKCLKNIFSFNLSLSHFRHGWCDGFSGIKEDYIRYSCPHA